ncbi:CotD family spore coat protein [Guptibacillus hwajinpoensis]|jgi:Inner spore coat protein D|uniref:CotD family spore coat protein n=1 Tax=Guptibacillus hwajinpoensis TaxID=208199 RepID=UPI001CD49E7E|nr:CotD family spore coat protein [Pseudalkalibacillus hwajinpoensis]MCA0990657.1 CotD family spore coat protein [Pseudalkalibacillus hwajinpoensis]
MFHRHHRMGPNGNMPNQVSPAMQGPNANMPNQVSPAMQGPNANMPNQVSPAMKGGMPGQVSPAMQGPGGPCPTSPVVYPTKCCVKNHYYKHNVDHIHPTHIKNVHHHMYEHNHSYPLTESDEVLASHMNNYPPPRPTGAMPAGYAPTSPSQVAGAMQGPNGNGMNGQVSPAQKRRK